MPEWEVERAGLDSVGAGEDEQRRRRHVVARDQAPVSMRDLGHAWSCARSGGAQIRADMAGLRDGHGRHQKKESLSRLSSPCLPPKCPGSSACSALWGPLFTTGVVPRLKPTPCIGVLQEC